MNRLFVQDSSGQRSRERRIVKNSEVIKVGDWITDEGTGAANVDAVTEKIEGLVVAVVNKQGVSLESPGAGAVSGWVASTKTFTAAADNETVGGVMVEYIPVREGDRFVATLDAAKGTTTGSNLKGYYVAILTSNSSLLDESTASTTITNTQFRIEDPLNSGASDEVVVSVHLRDN